MANAVRRPTLLICKWVLGKRPRILRELGRPESEEAHEERDRLSPPHFPSHCEHAGSIRSVLRRAWPQSSNGLLREKGLSAGGLEIKIWEN